MTVDLEDWAQAVVDPRLPVSGRVVANVERVLALLDRHGVRVTFFALGKVCEAHPCLLPIIRDAGHEIASHGYGHELVYRLSAEEFESDVNRSIQIIEAQAGVMPLGYRAPAFSITQRSRWAAPILSRLGIRYSSSVFPIAGRRYGVPDAPRFPHRWNGCDLIEFPLTTLRLAGRNWPACGGGYTRLLPAALLARAVRQANRRLQPAVVYLHPYELAPGEVRGFARDGVPVGWKRWFTQELWRTRVPDRLARLFDAFEFGPMARSLAQSGRPLVLPPSHDSRHARHRRETPAMLAGRP